MRVRLTAVMLLSSLALVACGAPRQREATGPETDPWADYKGTYATKGEAPKVEVAEPAPAPTPTPTPATPAKAAKPAKKGTNATKKK
jgi:hypothetical protein